MKLVNTIHRPDGMAGVVKPTAITVGRIVTDPVGVTDKPPKISCVWEYKLPSGKTGRCDAIATWELIYKTSMRQPFGAPGNVMLHSYRCDLHHTEETA